MCRHIFARYCHGIRMSVFVCVGGCLFRGLFLAYFHPSSLLDYLLFVISLPFSLPPSLVFLGLLSLLGHRLLVVPYEVYCWSSRLLRVSIKWICGFCLLISYLSFLICMCNPSLAFEIGKSVGSALFTLLPFSSCVRSALTIGFNVSTKLYHLSSVLPLSNFVSLLEHTVDCFISVSSSLTWIDSFFSSSVSTQSSVPVYSFGFPRRS